MSVREKINGGGPERMTLKHRNKKRKGQASNLKGNF